jgi:periplasmic divalent cation tolerance protein
MSACVVLVTAPSQEKAAELAKAIVGEKLAACVNVLPGVRSIYRWEGAVQDEAEVLMLVKTTVERFDALKARIVALHPYQVPEVIRVDVADGHAPYLDWLRASVV